MISEKTIITIKQMARLLSENELSELLIEAKDFKVWVERKGVIFSPQPEQLKDAKNAQKICDNDIKWQKELC